MIQDILSSQKHCDIIQSFFSLIYQAYDENVQALADSILWERISKESLDFYTIVLICNSRNFDIYQKIPLIQEKSEQILQEPLSLHAIKKMQCVVLCLLLEQNSLKMAEDIIRRIAITRNEGILEYDEEQKIRSVIRQIRPEPKNMESLHAKTESKQDYLKHQIQALITFMDSFRAILEAHSYKEQLEHVLTLLQGGRFSIGVTGVMSAGKSTLLNALLGREILGTSVVPETANLTVLKYALREKCVVHFWTQKEWDSIQKSAQFDEGIARFIQETRDRFGDSLTQYITHEGGLVEIPIEELTTYTSAKNTSKMCNLIKYVELYLPLEFLKDGVELVDTPGLDDPLTQREEITKNYLLNCDVIMHLMNAAQSATQKDLDFIIDALVNKHISSVLIVLTHADTVSSQDLKAVMDYTRNSFQNRLRQLQISESFDAIIQQIEFLPTAGYMALLHRIGRGAEALDKGYKLEDTGIFQVEAYLNEILFGEDSKKGKVMVCNACRESLDMFHKILLEIELQRSLLHTSKEDIQKRIQDNQAAQAASEEEIRALRSKAKDSLERLNEQMQLLKKGANFKMREYEQIIKERVLNLFHYAHEHQMPVNKESLQSCVVIGVQDGASEAKRDFCYKLEKAVHFFFEESKEFMYRLRNTQTETIDQAFAQAQEQVALTLAQTPFIDQTTVLLQGVMQLHAQGATSPKAELDKIFDFAFGVLAERTDSWSDEMIQAVVSRVTEVLEYLYHQTQDSFKIEHDSLLGILKERESTSVHDHEKKLLFEEDRLLEGKAYLEQVLKEAL